VEATTVAVRRRGSRADYLPAAAAFITGHAPTPRHVPSMVSSPLSAPSVAREQRTNRGSVTVRALDTNRRMVPIDGWDGSSRSDIPVGRPPARAERRGERPQNVSAAT